MGLAPSSEDGRVYAAWLSLGGGSLRPKLSPQISFDLYHWTIQFWNKTNLSRRGLCCAPNGLAWVEVNWSGGKLFTLLDANGDGQIDANDPNEFSFYHHGKVIWWTGWPPKMGKTADDPLFWWGQKMRQQCCSLHSGKKQPGRQNWRIWAPTFWAKTSRFGEFVSRPKPQRSAKKPAVARAPTVRRPWLRDSWWQQYAIRQAISFFGVFLGLEPHLDILNRYTVNHKLP